jgi:hypothetical protein
MAFQRVHRIVCESETEIQQELIKLIHQGNHIDTLSTIYRRVPADEGVSTYTLFVVFHSTKQEDTE